MSGPRRRRRAGLSTALLLALVASAFVAISPLESGASTGPTAVLGPVIGYDGLPTGGGLVSVSCVDEADCTAVSSYGYAELLDGTWGPLQTYPQSGSSSVSLEALSCSASSACTAVGQGGEDGDPLVATETAGTWSPVTLLSQSGSGVLDGISCTDAEHCTAVGMAVGSGKQEPVVATETAGTWVTVTEHDAQADGWFTSVDCASAGNCTAVGYDSSGAIAAIETGDSWGTVIPLGGASLASVSCSTATQCTAVGTVAISGTDEPAYVSESSGVWGAMTSLTSPDGSAQFRGVACTAPADCTAVGGDAIDPIASTESSGAWTAPAELPAVGGGGLLGISCSDTTSCTAVGAGVGPGAQPIAATMVAGSWSRTSELASPAGGSGSFTSVSCADPSECTAVGSTGVQPFYSAEVDGSWGPGTEIESVGAFDGVSCTDSTDCTAVGVGADDEPMYATETAGTWGPATELPIVATYAEFKGVSCTSASSCTAVGLATHVTNDTETIDPIYATESAGTWSSVTELSVTGGIGNFSAVSCTAPGDCTAVGDAGTAMYAREASGAWGPITAISSTSGPSLSAVSCWSNDGCTAVGAFGNGEPAYVTETGGSWGQVTAVPESTGQEGTEGGDLTSVSCLDATDCTAVGADEVSYIIGSGYEVDVDYWLTATETADGWGSAAELPPMVPAAPPVGSDMNAVGALQTGVSCASVSDCVAVGTDYSPAHPDGLPAYAATVPASPTIGSASLDGRNAAVSFSPPADDGGAPITGFRVLESFGGPYTVATTSPAVCTASPCSVTGLEGRRSYTFEVEAISDDGASPPSGASGTVDTPVSVPEAPQIVGLKRGKASVTVTFQSPWSGGDPITHYVVLDSSGGAYRVADTVPSRCTASPCTVTSLNVGARYTFEVEAVNAVGVGPASVPSSSVTAATTPSAPRITSALPGDRSAQVHWGMSTSDGGAAITSYTALARKGAATYACHSRTSTCTIRGLRNGVTYAVSVVASNAVGRSSPSATRRVMPQR